MFKSQWDHHYLLATEILTCNTARRKTHKRFLKPEKMLCSILVETKKTGHFWGVSHDALNRYLNMYHTTGVSEVPDLIVRKDS